MKVELTAHPQTDLAHLYDLSGGDATFVKEMIEYFLAHTPAMLADLADNLARQDWQGLSELAHKAKSSFRFLGAHTLADDARTVENDCRPPAQPAHAHVAVLVARIDDNARRAFVELEGELVRLSNA